MVDVTKLKTNILAHQAVIPPQSVEGTPVSVAGAFSAILFLKHAIIEATANDEPGTFRIYASPDSSGDENWSHVRDIETIDGTPDDEGLSDSPTMNPGVMVLGVDVATTGFNAKDHVYVQDTSIEADSEWHACDRVVAATSIDIMMGLTNTKDSADHIWNRAQQMVIPVPCDGVERYRVDYSHEGAVAAICAILVDILVATAVE